jgi:hypothetical protein
MQKTLASIVVALAIGAFSAAALAGEGGCPYGMQSVQSDPVVTADSATPPATPVKPKSGS